MSVEYVSHITYKNSQMRHARSTARPLNQACGLMSTMSNEEENVMNDADGRALLAPWAQVNYGEDDDRQ